MLHRACLRPANKLGKFQLQIRNPYGEKRYVASDCVGMRTVKNASRHVFHTRINFEDDIPNDQHLGPTVLIDPRQLQGVGTSGEQFAGFTESQWAV